MSRFQNVCGNVLKIVVTMKIFPCILTCQIIKNSNNHYINFNIHCSDNDNNYYNNNDNTNDNNDNYHCNIL